MVSTFAATRALLLVSLHSVTRSSVHCQACREWPFVDYILLDGVSVKPDNNGAPSFWSERCDAFFESNADLSASSPDMMIRVEMGTVIDYFRSKNGSTLCEMLLSDELHLFSPNGTDPWYDPPHHFNRHFGGSAEFWPRNHPDLEGDNRRYLSFWGSNFNDPDGSYNPGGCCVYDNEDNVPYWGRDFMMYIMECPPGSTVTTAPTPAPTPNPMELSESAWTLGAGGTYPAFAHHVFFDVRSGADAGNLITHMGTCISPYSGTTFADGAELAIFVTPESYLVRDQPRTYIGATYLQPFSLHAASNASSECALPAVIKLRPPLEVPRGETRGIVMSSPPNTPIISHRPLSGNDDPPIYRVRGLEYTAGEAYMIQPFDDTSSIAVYMVFHEEIVPTSTPPPSAVARSEDRGSVSSVGMSELVALVLGSLVCVCCSGVYLFILWSKRHRLQAKTPHERQFSTMPKVSVSVEGASSSSADAANADTSSASRSNNDASAPPLSRTSSLENLPAADLANFRRKHRARQPSQDTTFSSDSDDESDSGGIFVSIQEAVAVEDSDDLEGGGEQQPAPLHSGQQPAPPHSGQQPAYSEQQPAPDPPPYEEPSRDPLLPQLLQTHESLDGNHLASDGGSLEPSRLELLLHQLGLRQPYADPEQSLQQHRILEHGGGDIEGSKAASGDSSPSTACHGDRPATDSSVNSPSEGVALQHPAGAQGSAVKAALALPGAVSDGLPHFSGKNELPPTSDGLSPVSDALSPLSIPASDELSPSNDGLSAASDGLSPSNDGLSPVSDGLSPSNDGLSAASDGLSPSNDGRSPSNDGLQAASDGLSRPNATSFARQVKAIVEQYPTHASALGLNRHAGSMHIANDQAAELQQQSLEEGAQS